MSKDIFVFIEQTAGEINRVSFELLGEASSLAEDLGQQVVAVILADAQEGDFERELISRGADKVICAYHPVLKNYMTEPYAKIMYEVIKENDPEIVLFGATSIGRDIAPRLSARIKTGLTADCTALAIEPDTKLLRMTRPAFGGNLMAEILCKTTKPQMATVRPGVMQLLEKDESRQGEVEYFDCNLSEADMNIEILEIIPKTKEYVDITLEKRLVSCGRGMGSSDNLRMAYDLAAQLDAGVCGSRAAIDSGWLEKDLQVGQTGKTVKPDLYFALGISGAIQHVAGMENSGMIIAINKNETAPIFDVADLGIVGDVNVIVPKLIEELKSAKEKGAEYEVAEKNANASLGNVMFDIQDGIAYLTLNRQKSLNALNTETLKEINSVADMIRERDDVKVLIIRGAGRAFAAGADISEMEDMDEAAARQISEFAQSVFRNVKTLPQVVIGAVNGFALGGGNELAMACDIRIASSRAKFGQPEANLGILPGFTGTQMLSRIVGPGKAKELIFTTEMISAEEALRIGLVNKVVPPEALLKTARNMALVIIEKGLQGVRFAKRAINEGYPLEDIDAALKLENDAWTDCFATYDQKEGMSAFLEKRKPVFQDR